jgi:hypothetical protein
MWLARSIRPLVVLVAGCASDPTGGDDPDPGRCEAAPTLEGILSLGEGGQPLSGAAVSCGYAAWIGPYEDSPSQVWVYEIKSGKTFLTTQPGGELPTTQRSSADLHGFWLGYLETQAGATAVVLERLDRLERARVDVVLSDPWIDFHYPWIGWSGLEDPDAAALGRPTARAVWALEIETGQRRMASRPGVHALLAAVDADRALFIEAASRGSEGGLFLRDLVTDELLELGSTATAASMYGELLASTSGTMVLAQDLGSPETWVAPVAGSLLAGPAVGAGFVTWAELAEGVPTRVVWWPKQDATVRRVLGTAGAPVSPWLGAGERLVFFPQATPEGELLGIEVPVPVAE